jgi:hypothetical protein
VIDERFIQHRYKSTSHAAVVAGLLLAFFSLRDFYTHGVVRWDLAATMGSMALTKIVALVYYRLND